MKKLVEWLMPICLMINISCTSLNSDNYYLARDKFLSQPSHELIDVGNKESLIYIHLGKENKKVLIFLHGLCMNSQTWPDNLEYFSREGFEVYAVDMLGFGFSDKPKDNGYSIKELGESIKHFMDARKIKNASIIGNSLGGAVGIYLASHHPNYVNSLVLEDSIGGLYINEPFGFKIIKTPILSQLSFFFRNPKYIEKGIEKTVLNSESVQPYDMFSIPYQSENAWYALKKHLKNNDLKKIRDMTRLISQPTLVISGKEDSIVSVRSSKSLHSIIESARLEIINRAAHMPHSERPEEFNQIVHRFLR